MALSLLEQLLLYVHPRIRFKSKDRHIVIKDTIENGRAVRLLLYDNIRESGMYLDKYGAQDPLFHYMKTLKLILAHHPGINNVLLIGGGGFVFPKLFLNNHPERTIDVVELDPGYVELAKRYFDLNTNDPRIKITIQDGYSYMNLHAGEKRYDMIIYDAYTGENAAKTILSEDSCINAYSMLKPNGIYALNMINEAQDVISMQTHLTRNTLSRIFRSTRIVPCKGGGNCILMASDRKL